MMLVTTPTRCRLDAMPSPEIPAGERVVVPDDVGMQLISKVWIRGRAELKWSQLGNYTRHYCGQDLTDKTLMVHRGPGIGDQLIAGGICKILKDKYPGARIDLWHSGHRHGMWRGVGDSPLRSRLLPIPFSEWCEYDYHLIFENMVESDTETDQANIWEGHCNLAGIDWECEKLPFIHISEKARRKARTLHKRHADSAKFIFYQLSATSPIRSLPPWKNRSVLKAIRAAFPGTPILVPKFADEGQRAACDGIAMLVDMDIQTAFALVDLASVVVCPDSCFGHASSVLGTPCVSMWAAFHPDDRVSTYPNHRPIFAKSNCGPCRCHESRRNLITQMDAARIHQGCPANDSYCLAMTRITDDTIVDAIREVMK